MFSKFVYAVLKAFVQTRIKIMILKTPEHHPASPQLPLVRFGSWERDEKNTDTASLFQLRVLNLNSDCAPSFGQQVAVGNFWRPPVKTFLSKRIRIGASRRANRGADLGWVPDDPCWWSARERWRFVWGRRRQIDSAREPHSSGENFFFHQQCFKKVRCSHFATQNNSRSQQVWSLPHPSFFYM